MTRPDRRILLIALLASLSIILACLPSDAGVISPELDAVLRKIPPEEVSVIINLADKADISSIKDQDKHTRREKMVEALQNKANDTQGPLKSFLTARNAIRVVPFWIRNAVAATILSTVVGELAGFPGVESIEPDAVIHAQPVMQATAATPEWNISRIKAPDLWNLGLTGTGVIVANMDTGVDVNHPDLNSRWRGFVSGHSADSWYNPYTDPANCCYCSNAPTPISSCLADPGICSPAAACASCELSANTPCDFSGHGTGTMGVMVGGDAGGTSIGVAPGAKWIAVKIFNDVNVSPSAPSSIILQGFQWLLGLPADSAPDVVNNSWGEAAGGCDTTFQADIQTLKSAGIAMVFSAGNLGQNPSTDVSPANNPGSFAVGATDSSDTIASFSSRGPSTCDGSIFPHVVAPGVGIRVADLQLLPSPPSTPAYNIVQGTSFSAPHVAGGVALLLGAFPFLTMDDLESTLKSTAVPLPPAAVSPNNDYGYGLLDLKAAFDALLMRSTTGLYDPSTGAFSLKRANLSGAADTHFLFGVPGDIPVTGDWNGDGVTTVGVYRQGRFYLKNTNTGGFADIVFDFGISGDIPITGDWNGNGVTTVGVYRQGRFYLKNTNSGGFADVVFDFGISGDIPITGDWNGDGVTTVGVYRQGRFYLKNTNSGGFADIVFDFGISGDIPVTGDWNGDGVTTAGVYRQGRFYLKNTNTGGVADVVFDFGISGDIPVTGNWGLLP